MQADPDIFYIPDLSFEDNSLRSFSETDVTYGSEMFQDVINVALRRALMKSDENLIDYFISFLPSIHQNIEGIIFSGNYSLLLPAALLAEDNSYFLDLFDLFMMESLSMDDTSNTSRDAFLLFSRATSRSFGQGGYNEAWENIFLPAIRKHLTREEMSEMKREFLLGLVEFSDYHLLDKYLTERYTTGIIQRFRGRTSYQTLLREDYFSFVTTAFRIAVQQQNNDMLEYLITISPFDDESMRQLIISSAVTYGWQEISGIDIGDYIPEDVQTCSSDILATLISKNKRKTGDTFRSNFDVSICSIDTFEEVISKNITLLDDNFLANLTFQLAREGKYDLLRILARFTTLSPIALTEGGANGGHKDLILLTTPIADELAVNNFNYDTYILLGQ